MVASDGGIVALGDATFYGSMGATRLNAPVQSLVPTADGKGYWLVASDGGIVAFGDAPFRGSMGSTHLNRPVAGMVRFGDGYLMVGADSGIFNFSDKPFLDSLGNNPPATGITSVAAINGWSQSSFTGSDADLWSTRAEPLGAKEAGTMPLGESISGVRSEKSRWSVVIEYLASKLRVGIWSSIKP